MNIFEIISGFVQLPKLTLPQVPSFEVPDVFPYGVIVLAAFTVAMVLRQCKRTKRDEVQVQVQVQEAQPLRRSQRIKNQRGNN